MMLLEHPFTAVTPTVDGDVLEALARADHPFTTSQLHGMIGRYSYNGVRKVLERLDRQGIVRSERFGGTDVFRLNREHLAAGPIIELANLRSTFLRRIRSTIGGWSIPPIYAALFGSAARGDMHEMSDIDLFIVRPDDDPGVTAIWRDQLGQLQERVTTWTGNDARVLEYGEREVRMMWPTEPVLQNIRVDAITLFGSQTFWKGI